MQSNCVELFLHFVTPIKKIINHVLMRETPEHYAELSDDNSFLCCVSKSCMIARTFH